MHRDLLGTRLPAVRQAVRSHAREGASLLSERHSHCRLAEARRRSLVSLGCQQRALDIVAIAPAVVDGMGGREANALGRKEKACQQARVLRASSTALTASVRCKLDLNLVPRLNVNDGLMLAFVALAPMWNAADIDRIGDNEIEVPAAESLFPHTAFHQAACVA